MPLLEYTFVHVQHQICWTCVQSDSDCLLNRIEHKLVSRINLLCQLMMASVTDI